MSKMRKEKVEFGTDTTRLLRSTLRHLGEQALKLADALAELGRPLDRQERRVVKLAVNSMIQDLMEEATHFAVFGHMVDFEQAVQQVQNWVALRENLS